MRFNILSLGVVGIFAAFSMGLSLPKEESALAGALEKRVSDVPVSEGLTLAVGTG